MLGSHVRFINESIKTEKVSKLKLILSIWVIYNTQGQEVRTPHRMTFVHFSRLKFPWNFKIHLNKLVPRTMSLGLILTLEQLFHFSLFQLYVFSSRNMEKT